MTRLTSFAAGGGCACKIPAGQLETAVAGLVGTAGPEVLVGLDAGDDASAVTLRDDLALISTTDFFTPMLDDPYDWGRVAATNALSDVYAMGGTPVTALNIVGWPVDVLGLDILREVIRGGMDVATAAGISVTGGHSITAPEPIYGMAVSGTAHPDKLMGIDQAQPGLPITLTKPLGVGIFNNKHKATGEVSLEAVESMTTLNKDAAMLAVKAGIRAATDVTGFGLLGHLYKMCRASGVSAELDFAAVPEIPGAKAALREGFVPGGSRRNLEWVREHLHAPGLSEGDLVFLADAQTSGGLLVIGELPGYPVIGRTTALTNTAQPAVITVR
ncbi:segregation protein B [Corynebacterium phocae]|uniref:Selenide, water dikinase n=2 Tax=Corynebacterium phocae TaxID=161895 RepID=A0A1L7D433_9CORY|nr:selenide, water dikinase SelD [Corynebacterium phocae]APT92833.1 segregation protein B [Corynebacterium phocae]KAA8723150.1 selenide, water dikinase SelD [Corynebacterium phocae]